MASDRDDLMTLSVQKSYNPNVYAPPRWIGGQGGADFDCAHGTDGVLIKKLEVWSGPWQLRGIRVTLTDGTQQTFGQPEDRAQGSFEFQPGERITSLSLWGNGEGTRCGAFRIITNKGRSFFPKMYKWDLKTEYPAEVGSGIPCGLFGRAGADIDSLAFYLLRPITDSTLKDVTYPTLSSDLVATTPSEIDKVEYDNRKSPVQQSVTLHGSETFSLTTEWSSATALQLGVEWTVKAGIPLVADVQGTTKVSIGETFTYKSSSSSSTTRSIDEPCLVPAGYWMRFTATTYEDTLDLPYNGTFSVTVDSGYVFSYKVSGVYKGASVRSVFVKSDVLGDDGHPTTTQYALARSQS